MASVRKTAAKAEPEGTASAAPAEATLPEMTLEEVKKHASETDCFIAVDGLVCDVTEYLPNHPGSMEQLLDVAGQDATGEFFDHGHSLNAVRKMKELAVARLPKGEGERHTASVPTSGEQGSAGSTPVIGLVLLLVALAAYYMFTKQ